MQLLSTHYFFEFFVCVFFFSSTFFPHLTHCLGGRTVASGVHRINDLFLFKVHVHFSAYVNNMHYGNYNTSSRT